MKHEAMRFAAFLGSSTLTLWLVGTFLVYYLTLSVWSGEAFSRYVQLVASSTVFQAFFLLFLLNLVLWTADYIRKNRTRRSLLCLRLPFLTGLIMVLAAFFLSINLRQHLWLPPLGEGDPIELPWEQDRYQIISVERAISKRTMRTDASVLFDYEPGITIIGRDGTKREIGAFPPRQAGRSFLHVLQFGIGPGMELRKGGNVVWRGYMALRLLPFGVVDSFSIDPFPYQFSLGIVPTSIVQKGRETARNYDLEQPRYQVKVVKGDRTLAETETDRSVAFDGNMVLSFFTPSDWVIIEAVRDPILPWFAFSLLLFAAGVVLFPFSFLVRR